MTVLIMGSDLHAMAVHYYLRGLGVDSIQFDSRDKDWEVSGNLDALDLKFEEDCKEVRAIYWRSYDSVCLPANASQEMTDLSMHNRASIFESWLALASEERHVYNPICAWDLHKRKPWQMMLINKKLKQLAGGSDLLVQVPPTLWMQTPRADKYDIIKPTQGGLHTVPGEDAHNWPESVYCTLQRRITGQTYRAYVFRSEMKQVCYEVISPCLDYRDDEHAQTKLTKDVSHDALHVLTQLLDHFDWSWAGFDLMVEPQNPGIYWLLDMNPSPMFLGFGRGEVLGALCSELRDCDTE